MAVVNKHVQVWIPLQLAPYIVTLHPYISSCKPYLLRSTAATYVGVGAIGTASMVIAILVFKTAKMVDYNKANDEIKMRVDNEFKTNSKNKYCIVH